MKKLKKCLIRAGNVLTLVIFCSFAIDSALASEPSYDGKPLSDWLLLSLKGDDAAREAILHIGTNGIPTLLKILSATDRNKKGVVAKLESKELKQGFKGQYADVEDLRSLAVSGFGVLGTDAEPAVPQLTKLLHGEDTMLSAAMALSAVGPNGYAVLTNWINAPEMGDTVLIALRSGDPKVVTPLLIIGLQNTNPFVRGNAADFLAGKDAALAVPALIPILDDKEYYPRTRASIALASFGPAAKAAAPKLLFSFTNQPNVLVLDALRKIDRDTAGKAEIFLISGPIGAGSFGWSTTRLPNGKDLMAGGNLHLTIPTVRNLTLSRAELSDPHTGKREETGSMNVAREGHVAILLPNGKVLVAGGSNLVAPGKGGDLSSAELYDPGTEKWTQTGSLHSPHSGGKALLKPGGRVLYNQELYDPATGTWTVITQK